MRCPRKSDARQWSYTYDATGLRTSKQDGTATPYHFTWNRAAGLPLLLSQHVGSAVNHLIYGPGGTPIYQITSAGAVQYFHQDHQGSTRLVTDANGNTYGTITYDAYGRQTTNTSPWYLDRQLAGYTGEYTDAETGYTFLRARLLDHSTGQFTTRDPLESSTGEPYSYAGGSPLMRTDPSGLCWGPTCILPSPREVAEELVDRAGDAIESGRGAVRDTAREGWEVAREAATTAPGLSGRAIGALMRTNCRYSSADRVTYCEGSPTGRPVTIGNTVFMGMTHDQYAGRSGLHQHELRHVDQYALLGPLFLPLYGQASLSSIGTSLVLCPDPKMSMADRAACFNFLEIWSGRGSGGYSC